MAIIEPFKIELEGLDAVQEALTKLEESFGPSANNNISLLDTSRSDSDKTNVEILNYLCFESPKPRDVVSCNDRDVDKIAERFVDTIIAEVQNVLAKAAKREAKGKVGLTGREGSVINNLALRAAMDLYVQMIQDRIRSQVDFEGKNLEGLSKHYAAKKLKKFGFETPILKASGQLINSLQVAGRADVKLSRK